METSGRTMAERINSMIRAGEFGVSLEETPFLCECDDRHCHAVVWLDPDDFDQLRAEGRSVLDAGHHFREAAEGAAVIPLSDPSARNADRRLAV